MEVTTLIPRTDGSIPLQHAPPTSSENISLSHQDDSPRTVPSAEEESILMNTAVPEVSNEDSFVFPKDTKLVAPCPPSHPDHTDNNQIDEDSTATTTALNDPDVSMEGIEMESAETTVLATANSPKINSASPEAMFMRNYLSTSSPKKLHLEDPKLQSYWEVPFVYNFLACFKDQIRSLSPLRDISIEDLEQGLLARYRSERLEEIHVALLCCLLNAKHSVKPRTWQRDLAQALAEKEVKRELDFRNPFSIDMDYYTLEPRIRVLILNALVHWNLQESPLIREAVHLDQKLELQTRPLGRDQQKRVYWYFGEGAIRIYRETDAGKRTSSWEMVAGNMRDIRRLARELKTTKSRSQRILARTLRIEIIGPLTEAFKKFVERQDRLERDAQKWAKRNQNVTTRPLRPRSDAAGGMTENQTDGTTEGGKGSVMTDAANSSVAPISTNGASELQLLDTTAAATPATSRERVIFVHQNRQDYFDPISGAEDNDSDSSQTSLRKAFRKARVTETGEIEIFTGSESEEEGSDLDVETHSDDEDGIFSHVALPPPPQTSEPTPPPELLPMQSFSSSSSTLSVPPPPPVQELFIFAKPRKVTGPKRRKESVPKPRKGTAPMPQELLDRYRFEAAKRESRANMIRPTMALMGKFKKMKPVAKLGSATCTPSMPIPGQVPVAVPSSLSPSPLPFSSSLSASFTHPTAGKSWAAEANGVQKFLHVEIPSVKDLSKT